MRFSAVFLILAFFAMLAPVAGAAPRDFKLCSAAVQTCDCPLEARGCAPLCRIEPLIGCPAS
jgi:hypothetical protein